MHESEIFLADLT